METISFTAQKFEEFKRVYKACKSYHRQSFMFEGKEVLMDYAKYAIEYLEPKFKEAVK